MESSKAPCWMVSLVLAIFWIAGVAMTATQKSLFLMKARTCSGEEKAFDKPCFSVVATSLGQLVVGFGVLSLRRLFSGAPIASDELACTETKAMQETATVKSRFKSWSRLLVFIPSIADVAAFTLHSVGLVFVEISMFNLLKGSLVCWSAVISSVFLRRRKYAFQWLGVVVCMAGILVAGGKMLIDGQDGDGSASPELELVGMLLIIMGSAFQASFLVGQEFFIKVAGLQPLHVLGLNGAWSLVILFVCVLPLAQVIHVNGHPFEDSAETICMIRNNPSILGMSVALMLSFGIMLGAGAYVVRMLCAVTWAMSTSVRTGLVWIFGLSWHYFIDSTSELGEEWTPGCWLELVGFALSVLGLLVYAGAVKVPGLTPAEASDAVKKTESTDSTGSTDSGDSSQGELPPAQRSRARSATEPPHELPPITSFGRDGRPAERASAHSLDDVRGLSLFHDLGEFLTQINRSGRMLVLELDDALDASAKNAVDHPLN